jgi:hypothetical protein
MLSQVADILHMQPNDLRAQIQQGKSLGQIAQEQGVSADALADQLLQRMEQTRMQLMRDMIRRMLDEPMRGPVGPQGPGPRAMQP